MSVLVVSCGKNKNKKTTQQSTLWPFKVVFGLCFCRLSLTSSDAEVVSEDMIEWACNLFCTVSCDPYHFPPIFASVSNSKGRKKHAFLVTLPEANGHKDPRD